MKPSTRRGCPFTRFAATALRDVLRPLFRLIGRITGEIYLFLLCHWQNCLYSISGFIFAMSWNGSPFPELRYISATSSAFGQVVLEHACYLGRQVLLSQERFWPNVVFWVLVLSHLRPIALWLVPRHTPEVDKTLEDIRLKLAIVEGRLSQIEKDIYGISHNGSRLSG